MTLPPYSRRLIIRYVSPLSSRMSLTTTVHVRPPYTKVVVPVGKGIAKIDANGIASRHSGHERFSFVHRYMHPKQNIWPQFKVHLYRGWREHIVHVSIMYILNVEHLHTRLFTGGAPLYPLDVLVAGKIMKYRCRHSL